MSRNVLKHKEWSRINLGRHAESQALRFLQKKGLRLLEKNYRCYLGEIDLIMQEGDQVVFVEVRSRSRQDYGHALESVNKKKMRKVIRAAVHYLQRLQQLYCVSSRFDVVGIQFAAEAVQIEWVRDAFCGG